LQNDNSENPQPLGKATVSGTVFANFDYTNDTNGTTWDVVANKKVIVSIYDEYTETNRYTETTTDGSGNYTFEIEIGNRSLEVHVELVDFKSDVKQDGGTESEIFYGDDFSATIYSVEKGGEYIRDLYYND